MTFWRKRQIKRAQSESDIWESILAVMAIIGCVFLGMTLIALLMI